MWPVQWLLSLRRQLDWLLPCCSRGQSHCTQSWPVAAASQHETYLSLSKHVASFTWHTDAWVATLHTKQFRRVQNFAACPNSCRHFCMKALTTGTSSSADIQLGIGCLTGDLTGDLTSDLTGDLLFDLAGDEWVSGGGIAGVALYMNAVSSNLEIWLRSRLMSPCSTCMTHPKPCPLCHALFTSLD